MPFTESEGGPDDVARGFIEEGDRNFESTEEHALLHDLHRAERPSRSHLHRLLPPITGRPGRLLGEN